VIRFAHLIFEANAHSSTKPLGGVDVSCQLRLVARDDLEGTLQPAFRQSALAVSALAVCCLARIPTVLRCDRPRNFKHSNMEGGGEQAVSRELAP